MVRRAYDSLLSSNVGGVIFRLRMPLPTFFLSAVVVLMPLRAAVSIAYLKAGRTGGEGIREVGTCALNGTFGPCPLPRWKPTYNLTQSSIMYQPWCTNSGRQDCTGLINVTTFWAEPDRRDVGSTADAHWGLLALDDSESTQMWTSTTYGDATPGNPLTFRAQKAMLDNCNFVKSHRVHRPAIEEMFRAGLESTAG